MKSSGKKEFHGEADHDIGEKNPKADSEKGEFH